VRLPSANSAAAFADIPFQKAVGSMIYWASMEGPLTPEQLEPIRQALVSRNKIEAIKLFRAASETGLAEAKQAVEDLERQWGLASSRPASAQETHPAPKRVGATGCLVVAVATGLIAALCVAFAR